MRLIHGITDPAVYPYFDFWPSVSQPQMTPLLTPNPVYQPTPKLSSRLTHSELHAVVMMEHFGSSSPLRPREPVVTVRRQARRSHHDLHRSVFPSGAEPTLSGTSKEYQPINGQGHQTPSESYSQRRISYTRAQFGSPSTRIPLPTSPSPTRSLPTLPASRPPTIPELTPTPGSRPPPGRTYTRRPSVSVTSRYGTVRYGGIDHLPAAEANSRSLEAQPLSRSRSMALPRTTAEHDGKLDRSHSISIKPLHKRDSLVFQRVKAYTSGT